MRLRLAFVITLITLVAAMGCQVQESETAAHRNTEDANATDVASSFGFTAAGDYGSSRAATATLDLISRSDAGFNLALGNLRYTDTPEGEWCDYVHFKVGESFPFQLVAGNHEDDFGEDGNRLRRMPPVEHGDSCAQGQQQGKWKESRDHTKRVWERGQP